MKVDYPRGARCPIPVGLTELMLVKITAGTYASNIGSIKAFLACGFVQEGFQQSQVALDDGGRDDVVILGKLNPKQAGRRAI